ncbi:hypothetical protein C2845_PM01G11200 [Panicum miliaceum]|uniref:Uncharacterized protein n=1 Tax=Panicum miliaceum TaxID=4540 RepID=A0A3L6TF77_PANMI|nr:hypothetical protein C2845_PM01G11200 [Panicum miliaceum]
MSHRRQSNVNETLLEDFATKGFLSPKERRPHHDDVYPEYTSAESNKEWHGDWFYIRNSPEALVPEFHVGRPVRDLSWTWGTLTLEKFLARDIREVIRKRVVGAGLNGATLFFTMRERRVMSLVEQRMPLWLYSGPSDPDRAFTEELQEDDVCSWLMMVLKGADREDFRALAPFDCKNPPNWTRPPALLSSSSRRPKGPGKAGCPSKQRNTLLQDKVMRSEETLLSVESKLATSLQAENKSSEALALSQERERSLESETSRLEKATNDLLAELSVLWDAALGVVVDVLRTQPAEELLVADLQAVPGEVSKLIADRVFHSASGVLTSAAMHFPDLDSQVVGDGYATGWTFDQLRQVGLRLETDAAVVSESITVDWIKATRRVEEDPSPVESVEGFDGVVSAAAPPHPTTQITPPPAPVGTSEGQNMDEIVKLV